MPATEQESLTSDQVHRIHRTAHRSTANLQYVYVDHASGHIGVARPRAPLQLGYARFTPRRRPILDRVVVRQRAVRDLPLSVGDSCKQICPSPNARSFESDARLERIWKR